MIQPDILQYYFIAKASSSVRFHSVSWARMTSVCILVSWIRISLSLLSNKSNIKNLTSLTEAFHSVICTKTVIRFSPRFHDDVGRLKNIHHWAKFTKFRSLVVVQFEIPDKKLRGQWLWLGLGARWSSPHGRGLITVTWKEFWALCLCFWCRFYGSWTKDSLFWVQ